MIARLLASPVIHRLLAFALAIYGGDALGRAVRTAARGPLLDFGALYVGAWSVRAGHSWARLYDPEFLSGAVAEIAPAGRIVDLGAVPPLGVVLALPFTAFTADYGKFVFAAASAVALLFALFTLGAGRALGWNRTEWLAFAGLVLGSAAVRDGILRGTLAPWVFASLAVAVSCHALGRRHAAAVASAFAANLDPVGWGPLVWTLIRGRPDARWLGGLLAAGGLGAQAWLLGADGLRSWASALAGSWVRPLPGDATLAGLASRVGVPVWMGAAVALALAAFLVLSLHRPFLESAASADAGDERRLNMDPPRAGGLGPAVVAGLIALAAPAAFRGHALVLAIPLHAALARLEMRPGLGKGLFLFAIAVLLLLPWPIAERLGPARSANWICVGALGVAAFWAWSLRAESRD